MCEQFGASSLIGKSVAIIADARIGGRTDATVVCERLLSISGEDLQTIPRKVLPDSSGRLAVRFMVMTNELPRIEDASSALTSTFIILTLQRSFYGREDHGLADRFIPELPGILNWALSGWDRLNARSRFEQPASASKMIQEFEDRSTACRFGCGGHTYANTQCACRACNQAKSSSVRGQLRIEFELKQGARLASSPFRADGSSENSTLSGDARIRIL